MNLEQALDHADLVGDCVSTSAKALKTLAEEVRRLRSEYCDNFDDGINRYGMSHMWGNSYE